MNGYNSYGSSQPQFQQNGWMGAMQSDLSLSTYVNSVMRRVMGKMTLGVLLTAVVSLLIVSNPAIIQAVYASSILMWGLLIAQFGIVIWLSARINKMSTGTATALFYLYAALTGVTLTPIFAIYTGTAIVKTFFITAGVFGSMAVYGYVTKKDLSRMGSILFMALIGLIIASLVNIFLASSGLSWAISILGVIIFTGLTAWDAQKIKQMAAQTSTENVGRLATIGALSLYLEFINLFLYLLRIFGGRE